MQCPLCGVRVKYKREHLNKKHKNISEDVYLELMAGKEITKELRERLKAKIMTNSLATSAAGKAKSDAKLLISNGDDVLLGCGKSDPY